MINYSTKGKYQICFFESTMLAHFLLLRPLRILSLQYFHILIELSIIP